MGVRGEDCSPNPTTLFYKGASIRLGAMVNQKKITVIRDFCFLSAAPPMLEICMGRLKEKKVKNESKTIYLFCSTLIDWAKVCAWLERFKKKTTFELGDIKV